MFTKKSVAACMMALGLGVTGFAQKPKEEFKPSGKVIGRAFLDYSQTLRDKKFAGGYNISRAFLGYSYDFAPGFQATVILDGASGNSNGALTPYLRNAFVKWSDKSWNINAGVLNLLSFKTQEDYWGHRYLMKSFQDEVGISASVDLGVTAKYNFNQYLSADLTLINGESYRNVASDSSSNYGLGIDIKPIKGLIIRGYGSFYTDNVKRRGTPPKGWNAPEYKNSYIVSAFVGYQNKIFNGGAEYSRLNNRGFIKGQNLFGVSVFGTVKFAKKWNAFTRFDTSKSGTNDTNRWNEKDNQTFIAGVEYQPFKQLKISPNFRNINPNKSAPYQQFTVNVEFNL